MTESMESRMEESLKVELEVPLHARNPRGMGRGGKGRMTNASTSRRANTFRQSPMAIYEPGLLNPQHSLQIPLIAVSGENIKMELAKKQTKQTASLRQHARKTREDDEPRVGKGSHEARREDNLLKLFRKFTDTMTRRFSHEATTIHIVEPGYALEFVYSSTKR
ncbi:hypothetical protein FNV43_RR21045 [Rhamnella rubrinervis]|uniref:Uncharacterized protein n=1 Tax=Rhamnella rubrinervis TaxID=2594499 RepID=A0A8K0E1X6_9ROSA|nr:hypothetical protein FNV43_RR21045 [Rhamnella rubrinervis]